MKIFNSHSHFGVEIDREKMSLRYLFDKSYVGWQNGLGDENEEAVKAYFEKNMTMKVFIQLKRAVEKLYGDGLNLNEKTWHIFDEKIKGAYLDGGYENHVLKNICGYDEILLDDYINIRKDGSGEVHCRVALRCDFMFYGYSREGLMSCEANPFDFFDDLPDNIDDYTKKMREYIKESYEMGKCAAIKVCMAYFRDIAFEKVEKDKANQVYSNLHNPEYIKFFQDYVMDMICIIAEEFSIPVQIHTGLGQIYGTSPIDIMPMIKRHDRVKFSLLHGGFPWTDDLLAVLYHCSNTYLDICWMPLLSTKIAVETVISALELIGSKRIIWGCDAATVEESYGALLATFEILDEVEESFIKRKFFGREEAQILREKILYSNAKELFG